MLLSSAIQHDSFHTTTKLSYGGRSLVQATSDLKFAGSLDMSDGLNQTIFVCSIFHMSGSKQTTLQISLDYGMHNNAEIITWHASLPVQLKQ